MADASPDEGHDPGVGLDGLGARGERAWHAAQETWADHSEAAKGFSKELLAVSPLARLRAQAASMAVTEQAKGALIAQQGCSPEEAFDLLRRASQQSNDPVRDLAGANRPRRAEAISNCQEQRRLARRATLTDQLADARSHIIRWRTPRLGRRRLSRRSLAARGR